MNCTECDVLAPRRECSTCHAKLCRNPECITLHMTRKHPARQLSMWEA